MKKLLLPITVLFCSLAASAQPNPCSKGITGTNALQVSLGSKGQPGFFNGLVQQIDGESLVLFDEATTAIGRVNVGKSEVHDRQAIAVGTYVVGYGIQTGSVSATRASGEATTAAVVSAKCISLSPLGNALSAAVRLADTLPKETPRALPEPTPLAVPLSAAQSESVATTPNPEDADGALNAAYKATMARLDAAGKARLRTEQRAWIKERDAECAPSNFAYPKAIDNCVERVTLERTPVPRAWK